MMLMVDVNNLRMAAAENRELCILVTVNMLARLATPRPSAETYSISTTSHLRPNITGNL